MTPHVRTTWRLFATGVLPWWAGVALALAAVAAAMLFLRGELRRRRRSRPALLCTVRALVVLCLGILALQPVLFIRREWERPGVLALVADRSRSMLRTDRYPEAMRLDLAAALGLAALSEREVSPGRTRQRLLSLRPAAEAWRQQMSAMHDELAQGLPWGPAFAETAKRQAAEAAALSTQVRQLVDSLSPLETRLAARPEAGTPAPEAPAPPDPKLLSPLYVLADEVASLRDAVSEAAGTPLDEERTADLVGRHDRLLAAWRAAEPALAQLQRACDAQFLAALPEAARDELEALAAPSRFALAKGLATRIAADPKVAARHRVRLIGFQDLAPHNALECTDLTAPIERLLLESLDQVVAGVVLFSDGGQNLPERPAVLRRLASREVSLVLAGVGVGSELPDLAVVDYRLPAVLLAGEDATLHAELKTAVPRGTSMRVELAAGGRVLAKQTLKTDAAETHVALPFRVPRTGDEGLTLSVSAPEADAAPENDRALIAPQIRSRGARVLVVAREARWDVVYLLAALRTRPCRVDLALWGEAAGRKTRRGLGFGKIPDKLSHLKRYDLVVLDGEPFPEMTADDGALFARYVREAGGTLLVVADGEAWYGPKLRGLLPARPLVPIDEEARHLAPLPAATRLPATSLSANGSRTEGIWASLPPARRLRVVPDQAVPLLAAGGRTVLSVGFHGRGKLYAFGCGDLFRLREWGRGEPVRRFLASLLDDALQPVFHDPAAKLALYPFAPVAGAAADVIADLRGLPLTAGAAVVLPGGTRVPLAFAPMPNAPGLLRAGFRVPAAGALAVETPGVAPLSARAVSSVSQEDIDFALDTATLSRLARAAGGRVVALPDVARAVAALPARPDRRVAVREIRLWSLWWLLPALAALMTADWVLRRRSGLVL